MKSLVGTFRAASLLRVSAHSALLLVIGKALVLCTVLALSALMPLDDYGEFMYGRGIVLFWGQFMALGMSVMAMRRIPAYLHDGDVARARGYVLTLLGVTFAVSLAVALGLGATGRFQAEGARLDVLIAAVVGLPGFAMLVSQMQAARAVGRVAMAYGPTSIGHPVTFGLVAAALVWGAGERSAVAMTWAYSLTMLLYAALQAVRILRLPELRHEGPVLRDTRGWLREGLPLTLSLVAQGVCSSGPLLILGLFATGEPLGIFGFYQSAMQGLLIFNTAIFGAAIPRLSVLSAAGDRAGIRALLHKSRWSAAAASAAGGLAGGLLVILFGGVVQPAFTTAPWTLALLLASVAVNALSGPLGHILLIERRTDWEVWSQILSAAVTLVTAFVLIPEFGLFGAALATFLAALVRTVLVHVLVYRRLGYRLG